VLGSDALMVVPPWCVEEDLESGRLVALGSEPYITIRYGIVRLKSHSLSAASARFREFVLEAEWVTRSGRASCSSAGGRNPLRRRLPAARPLQRRRYGAHRGHALDSHRPRGY